MIRNEKGQIVVEYILLLLVSIGIATTIVSLMVSRDEGAPGFIIRNWLKYSQAIASDLPDSPKEP